MFSNSLTLHCGLVIFAVDVQHTGQHANVEPGLNVRRVVLRFDVLASRGQRHFDITGVLIAAAGSAVLPDYCI
ncbi:hypothetical protein HKB18_03725 [Vibrio parahaemolyticus]|nr:hypothetical protein [Vibrio parahaemolyticus]